jgi:SsrA-binding protein
MSKREITKLIGKLKESGLTLIPLSLYFSDGKAKVEMGLARGKKAHDKRSSLMEKQASREVDRELSRRASGKSASGKSASGKSGSSRRSSYDD